MPTRLAAALTIALAAALLSGCGGSSSTDSTATPAAPVGAAARSCETETVDAESLRATGVGCARARQVMFAWQRADGCEAPAGASRSACSVRSYRCVAVATDRGRAVSCSRQGESLAFLATRR